MGRGTSSVSVTVLVLLCALVVELTGCNAPGLGGEQEAESQQGTTSFQGSTEDSSGSGDLASGSEAVELTGLVEQPAILTVADLQELPTETADVGYETHQGFEQHTYRGVRLYEVIDQSGLKLNPDQKSDQLRKYLVISAKDGYEVLVSWGEIDPEFANAPILLAWEEDGETLTGEDGPVRLVVPTDRRGGRYVSGVVRVEVRDAASGAES